MDALAAIQAQIKQVQEKSEEGQKAVVSVVNEALKRSDSVKWMINYIQSIKTKHSTLC